MAGLGRKIFNTGEVLTAANVQGYLMDQTVMVFADESARNTAIPSPTEGMFAYLSDTDLLTYYDGAAWVPFEAGGGAGLQDIFFLMGG